MGHPSDYFVYPTAPVVSLQSRNNKRLILEDFKENSRREDGMARNKDFRAYGNMVFEECLYPLISI